MVDNVPVYRRELVPLATFINRVFIERVYFNIRVRLLIIIL